ncbi:MAG: hypothetical protein LBK58_04485 [Prevotellaceae bacterium]|jgi:division protein CdvB (Snf7/Vps24/ESCRT-III family)|nr:hypothetical protein [Prevotellaceae bacterium]
MKTENLHDEIEVPSGLEARLEALIDRLDEAETRSKRKARTRLWTGIAASIAILIFAGLLSDSGNKPAVPNPEVRQIDDPETAYIEVRKALELMSENLNKGIDEFSVTLASELEKSNEIINKTLKY